MTIQELQAIVEKEIDARVMKIWKIRTKQHKAKEEWTGNKDIASLNLELDKLFNARSALKDGGEGI